MDGKLKNLSIIASSGCHRYDYWHEQYLFDGRSDTGWCTPSRSAAQEEYIIISLERNTVISKIRMLSREINENAGFPVDFDFFMNVGDNMNDWIKILSVRDFQNKRATWHEWFVEKAISGNMVKLLIYKVGVRPENKYFTQFMCLELFKNI
ncbi:MAG: discoidin domain-containing protein [Clostridium sp.]|jgi:allantoicase|nr:discoidin domain-containing protein [Clostridium sp.]